MISAVIVTYNEGQSLKDCLESIRKEVDEIVIVDLGSEDKTLEVAKDFRAKIFTHKRVNYVEKIRDFAVSKTKGDYVLVLDSDERMTSTLWEKLKEVKSKNKYDAVNIPRKNIFFGRKISYTNWWPDQQIRFFKKGAVSWGSKIHSYPKVKGKIYNLDATSDYAIIHYGYKTVSEFMDRQNRYCEIEAKNLYDEGIRFSWFAFFWKPLREFLVRYVRHAGFLDGFYGFMLSVLMMIYQLEVMVKLWELERNK